jgi:uncharacterized protein (UPF0335 family)
MTNLNNLTAAAKVHFDKIMLLENEKADLAEDIKGAYAGAKEEGLDAKALRGAVRFAKAKSRKKLLDEQEALDTYLIALGLVDAD